MKKINLNLDCGICCGTIFLNNFKELDEFLKFFWETPIAKSYKTVYEN